jgi:hypothetical protein
MDVVILEPRQRFVDGRIACGRRGGNEWRDGGHDEGGDGRAE